MLHTIQAELFQLIRSKLFWITEGLLFLLIFVSSFGEASFSLYVSGQDEIVRQGWTGFQALNQVAHDFLPFVMIAVLVLTTSLLGQKNSTRIHWLVAFREKNFIYLKSLPLQLPVLFNWLPYLSQLLSWEASFMGLGACQRISLRIFHYPSFVPLSLSWPVVLSLPAYST